MCLYQFSFFYIKSNVFFKKFFPKFLEFLSTKESQEIYTQKIHEYSIRKDVLPSTTVSNFGSFNADNLELEKLSSKMKHPIYLASKKKR